MSQAEEPPRQFWPSMAAFAAGLLVYVLICLVLGRFAVDWPLGAAFVAAFAGAITTVALAPRRPLRHAVEIGVVFILARLSELLGPAAWPFLAATFAAAVLAGLLRQLQLRQLPRRID